VAALLQIARRDIVADHEAEDVVECLRFRDVLAGPAQDQRQLGFVHAAGDQAGEVDGVVVAGE